MDEFNREMDKKFYDLYVHFKELQNNLDKLYKEQPTERKKKLEEKYNGITIKPSNLNKKLELYVQR